MGNITVDLDGLAFNAQGQQIGIQIPAEYLDQVTGGLRNGGLNYDCGDKCQNSNNKVCGRTCAV